MSVREILWPTRWKITASFLIAAVSVFLIYILNPYYRDALFSLDFSLRIVSVFASFAIVTAIYYPLACGVIFLFKSVRQKKKPKRKDMAIAILLVLVFNPLTFSLLYGISLYVNNNIINYPCGVEIFGFADNSPAQMSGMQTGEIIIQVDNRTIDTTESLTRVLAGKSPGESVAVKTNLNEYDIHLGENPETHRAVMGIITQNAYCRR